MLSICVDGDRSNDILGLQYFSAISTLTDRNAGTVLQFFRKRFGGFATRCTDYRYIWHGRGTQGPLCGAKLHGDRAIFGDLWAKKSRIWMRFKVFLNC